MIELVQYLSVSVWVSLGELSCPKYIFFNMPYSSHIALHSHLQTSLEQIRLVVTAARITWSTSTERHSFSNRKERHKCNDAH